jgi:hypothetical protein
MTKHGMAGAELGELKNQVSAAVLKNVKGVSGVGLPEQGITIYLEADTPEIRDAVAEAIKPLKLTVPLHWVVTGKFER